MAVDVDRLKPLTDKQRRLLANTNDDDLTSVFGGYPRSFLRKQREKERKRRPPETTIKEDAARFSDQARLRDAERLYRKALEENQRLQQQIERLAKMPDVEPRAVRIVGKPGEREATAVVLASDWHAEEPVDPDQVNGLNEYSVEIFKRRASHFFGNALRLLRKEAQAIEIRNLILWLGGDFISNSIHEDLAESNQLGPVDAIRLVQDTVAGGIRHMLAETPKELKLTIPCSSGNHGRMTQERRVQTERENSIEWLMYAALADHFRDEKRVEFLLSRGYHSYVEAHGFLLRFHHGHAIGYGGGIGGITIPTYKKIAQWNKARPAYLDLFGHFHSFFDGGNFVCNGSLIGYNEYAITIGASYEPPRQAFLLIDNKHGKTVVAPVLLEAV